MKIGFSFGRCVASIVRGEVAMEDVLCIVARTHMRDNAGVKIVIDDYLMTPGYLLGLDPEQCHQVGIELWESGRILEPRANGIASGMRVPKEYVWMDLYPTEPNVQSDSVKTAWETYRTLITLTEQLPEPSNFAAVQHGVKILQDG